MTKHSFVRALTLIAILIIAGYFNFFYHQNDPNASAIAQFNDLLTQSNRSTLDLTSISDPAWDELVFWSPYADICDYGIEKFEKNSPNCMSSKDDGECAILLLKKNVLVAQIPVNRRQIDFTKLDVKARISKERAQFKFTSKEDWPGVELITSP